MGDYEKKVDCFTFLDAVTNYPYVNYMWYPLTPRDMVNLTQMHAKFYLLYGSGNEAVAGYALIPRGEDIEVCFLFDKESRSLRERGSGHYGNQMAKCLLDMAIDRGANLVYSFDLYGIKLYQEAGFVVVDRCKFDADVWKSAGNRSYDWDEVLLGKPDFVTLRLPDKAA